MGREGELRTREEFVEVVRVELAARDKKRRSRLMDPNVMAEADVTFVAKVAEAVFPAPPEAVAEVKKTAARARRAASKNTKAAFPEESAS